MDLYGCVDVDVILRITPEKTDVSVKELQKTVYAYVSFLCSRYSSEQYGIAGIILGDTDFTDVMSADAYASLLYAAALAVNDVGGECGIAVPVSSNYESTTAFLEGLCSSAQLSSGLSFTAMIESGINPYGITDETTDKALNKNGKDVIAADNYADFRLFLFDLSEKYGNIFINSIYHFTPDANLNEDTLNAVYVYTYLSMLFGGRVGSYIFDVDGMPDGVIDTVRYINSSRCDEEIDIDGIASVFRIEEWSKEFYKYSKKNLVAVAMKESDATDTVKGTFTGTYGYFDFSSSAGVEDWYKGTGCDGISTGKNALGKALVARFSQGKSGGDFILHGYRYTESFRYTDFIELELMLESEAPEYTVSVNMGGEGFLYVYTSSVLKANEKEKLYIDVTDLTENNKVEYISIEINKDGDAVSDEKLYLYSVNAKSKTYSSEELTGLIEAERERLRDSAEQLSEESKDYISAIIFIVFVVLATVVVTIMLSRKQKQDDTRKD
jgi:hypothetical protein